MAKEAKKKEKKMKDNTDKKASNKDKRHFFKDVKAELKKVIWPTKKQLVNNTVAVISIVLIVGIAVFVLDVCLEKINSFGVNKLKTIVQSTQTNEISENTEIENLISENSETQESTEADAEVTE